MKHNVCFGTTRLWQRRDTACKRLEGLHAASYLLHR
jgi:hypothetical protein